MAALVEDLIQQQPSSAKDSLLAASGSEAGKEMLLD
eukprot:COSAG01_NODE_50439_length_363_cov_1.147727_2_plen_35_part_01